MVAQLYEYIRKLWTVRFKMIVIDFMLCELYLS